MKWVAFFIGEAVVLVVLGALLFLRLLYQPTWVWVVAPLVVLAAFIGIGTLAKSMPRMARRIALFAPFAVALPFASSALSFNAALSHVSPASVLGAVVNYLVAAALLGLHYIPNARVRPA
jgi:cobalamin synthase